jgi:acyl-CoA reductase-like NAD-dependent aldehyde dehydrogenase
MFENIHQEAYDAFRSKKTFPIEFRKKQIYQIYRCLTENKEQFLEALLRDGKTHYESLLTEFTILEKDISHVLKNISSWTKDDCHSLELLFNLLLDRASICYEPLGVVLIIGTWNYPINTTISPLVDAIAAGNCAVIKVSEVSWNTGVLMAELFPKYLDHSAYHFVTGSAKESTELLKLKWDHIFYTGSTKVGKIIAKAAAENLTTCTLELGGKSPTIVDYSSDLSVAAARITSSKFFNNGQTCIAPDYVLIPQSIISDFIELIDQNLKRFYTEDIQGNENYGRIVSADHFNRLCGLLKKSKGKVEISGKCQKDDRGYFIHPHVVVVERPDEDELMKDEIFGPILVIVPCESSQRAIDFINKRPKPLACYMFSNDSKAIDSIKTFVPAGAFVVNDCMTHFVTGLPFGGVGDSGSGCYHGKYGFKTFSHAKPVLVRRAFMEFMNSLRYPPYIQWKSDLSRKFLVGGIRDPESNSWF